MPNAFDRTNKTKFKRSKRHEQRWAKKLGGNRVPGSGAIRPSRWSKRTAGGDVRTRDLYIEHKRTDRASLGVKRSWLERISQEAACRGLTPAVGLTFEGRFGAENDWVAVPLSFLRDLMDQVKDSSGKDGT